MNRQTLTEAQQRKIAENKQRALDIRAKKMKTASIGENQQKLGGSQLCKINTKFPSSSSSWNTNKYGLPHRSNNHSAHSTDTLSRTMSNYKNTTTTVSKGQPNLIQCTKSQKKQVNFTNPSSQHLHEHCKEPPVTVSKDKFYNVNFNGLHSDTIKGKCVLLSQDRFCVECQYHSTLIEYFKQMETRSYDSSSRKWSFQLKEYDTLYEGVMQFLPDIYIEPLPPIIRKTFINATTDNGIVEADLSSVDNILVNTLLPFQKEGVYFAINREGRLLLADDMGLGKTLQAICIAACYRSEWPLLVVTPSSVRFDWAQQIYKWLPTLDPQEVNVIDSGKCNVKQGSVSIISYDLMPKKIDDLKERRFRVVIMDESHFLKNSKAIRTKAAVSLTKLAKRVILLSGTPALSRPNELFTQITIVCPSMFKFHDFGVRYCAGKLQPWGWDYSGSSNLEELQLLLEKKIMIRRQKSDVLQQLPDKTRQVIVLNPVLVSSTQNLNNAQKLMGKASLKGLDKRGALFQYFHETCKAKLKAVKDYILDLVESEKKFLMFAHHQEMLDCVEDAINQSTKVKFIRIDGSTKSEQRSVLCRRFQMEEDYRVALLSITAANAGLNLSAASLVVFAELFWNPGILVQAEDRVHRIGQKNSVSIHYLVARKTADDYIWPLVQDKLSILTQAGLTKDCFSNADTRHILDEKQKTIMEMFEQDFIDVSSQSTTEDVSEEFDLSGEICSCPVTPSKLKRKRSSSQSPSFKSSIPSSPLTPSPRKHQILITKFLKSSQSEIDTLKTNINKNRDELNEVQQEEESSQVLLFDDEGWKDTDYDQINLNDSVCSNDSKEWEQCFLMPSNNDGSSVTASLSVVDCQTLKDDQFFT